MSLTPEPVPPHVATPGVCHLFRRANSTMKPMPLLLATFRLQMKRFPTKQNWSRNINPLKPQNP
jgi:hypothetical protein